MTPLHVRGALGLAAPCACSPALALSADPALTIYNQNFAVIREILLLDLTPVANPVRFSGATTQVEPDSVILRDPSGRQLVHIVEQNYRSDPVPQDRLLNLNEGKTIEFIAGKKDDGTPIIVSSKIIRSGYVPHYQGRVPA
jgi:hypothetical protein